MPRGCCRLCGVDTDLQLSHILPAFVFRWLRESSGSGYLRFGSSPNLRVQDGLKCHWLCASCEGLLGRSETDFAAKLFYPFTSDGSSQIIYGEWLLRFCVSVSWRVLQYFKDETSLKGYEPDAVSRIAEADATWKAFLLSQRPHPGSFQQHLLPFDAIESISNRSGDLSPNFNRYLMRSVDMDLVRGEKVNFICSKLGRFVIVGFIREDRLSRWQGSKVHVKSGWIEPRRYTLPREFFEYLNSRARRETELFSEISPRQLEKSIGLFEPTQTNLSVAMHTSRCRMICECLVMPLSRQITHSKRTGQRIPRSRLEVCGLEIRSLYLTPCFHSGGIQPVEEVWLT